MKIDMQELMMQIYQSKDNARYPKDEYVDECWNILLNAEKNNPKWIALDHKAPSRNVVYNYLIGRTELKDPLYKQEFSEKLGLPLK